MWVSMLKYADSFTMWGLVLILIIISFLLLIKAYKVIPVGVAYAVFVGLGTTGTYAVGVAFLGESITVWQSIFLVLLIIGIIGLKFTTREESK